MRKRLEMQYQWLPGVMRNAMLRGGQLTIVAVCVICMGLLGTSASAQQAKPSSQSALAVSPAITEQVLTPGVNTKLALRVTNITRVPLPIKASIKNLIPLENLLPAANKATYDASAWFSLDPADFILQPNQTKEVAVTILPPPRATPGGHYATVYFQPLVPTEALSPSTAYLNARVGVLAFLIVKGNITEQATIGHLRLPRLRQHGPIGIVVPVSNNGNVHVLPEGRVLIRDFRGKTVETIPLPAGIVLPKTVRDYVVSWDNRGKLGYYTSQAQLVYGTGKVSLHSTTAGFWVVPWLPVTASLLLASCTIWFVVRTRTRWASAWRVLRGDDNQEDDRKL